MAVNYSKQLPQDRNNVPMVGLSTPFPAIATTADDNVAISSIINLNANTTLVEVAAIGGGAGIKWVMNTNTTASSSVITAQGTANFDNFVPAGVVRQFVVPRNSQGIPNFNGVGNPSTVGLNTSEGLYNSIAIKGAGISSVLVTEY